MKNRYTKTEIEEIVISTVASECGVDEKRINLDVNILYDLGGDSLDIVEIIAVLEETFEIEVDDAEVDGLTTPRKMVDYVSKKTNTWVL